MKKIISFFCAAVVLMTVLSLSISAAPTDSFTRKDQPDGKTSPVFTREMYTAVKSITASTLNLEESLEGITDICCGEDGAIYLLCGEKSRLVVLNEDYTFKKELKITDDNGDELDFTGAQGVFVDGNQYIYIADTENRRVIIVGLDGLVKSIWSTPESSLIPDDFIYKPVALSVDNKGYCYILSLGSYYGALTYSPDGKFMGFYGANTVTSSALDMIEFLWEKLTSNDVKKAASVKKLPYSFVDLCLDTDGYMVTCTGVLNPSENGVGQIRKISPDGSNILYKRSTRNGSVSSSEVNFLESSMVIKKELTGDYIAQDIVSINVNADGFIFALDRTNGLVYVYDSECNLLNAFGGGLGTGKQLGVFNTPDALALHGSSILVADSLNKSVTVFEITDYGKLLLTSQALQIKGDYSQAETLWQQVLSMDRGNQLAYRGLAMTSYGNGDYQAALDYAKSGLDYTVYDLAWQKILTNFIAKNFIWIFLLIALLSGGLITLFIISKKRQVVFIQNIKFKTFSAVSFHPFRSFEDIKYKGQGSLIISIVLMVLLYLAFLLKKTSSGFLFTDIEPQSYNMLYTLAQTIGLLLLWSVSSWLVCSLFSGKGKFKEVLIVSSYALTPLIIFTFLHVVLSNFLPLSSENFLNGMQAGIWIFTFFLLFIAIMTVHEYDFFKFVLTGIVVVFFMILVVFVLFMITILLKMFGDFAYSLYEEFVYR